MGGGRVTKCCVTAPRSPIEVMTNLHKLPLPALRSGLTTPARRVIDRSLLLAGHIHTHHKRNIHSNMRKRAHKEDLQQVAQSRPRRRAARTAPPPAEAEAPAPSFDRLPTDILVLILRHFRLYPLLRIASFVSKKWRAAALRAVTTLKIRNSVRANDILALFPNLTDVAFRLTDAVTITHLPPGVRRLRVNFARSFGLLTCPPALTHLTTDELRHMLPLLRASQDTLAYLNVQGALPSELLPLPALRALHVDALDRKCESLWIHAYASQLTALATSLAPKRYSLAQLPNLRALTAVHGLELWLRHAPSLEHLDTNMAENEGLLNGNLLARLKSIAIDSTPLPEDALARLPQISSVRMTSNGEAIDVGPLLGARLVKLWLDDDASVDWEELAPTLPVLRELRFNAINPLSSPVRLPCLAKLTIVAMYEGAEDALSPVPCFIPSCPSLNRLRLRITKANCKLFIAGSPLIRSLAHSSLTHLKLCGNCSEWPLDVCAELRELPLGWLKLSLRD